MDKMPWWLIFLQSMPETALMVSLGLVLIGIKPRIKPVILIALLSSLWNYFIRLLPFSPGINIFIQLPVLIILIAYLIRLPVKIAIIVSFLGLICLALTEALMDSIITALTGITIQQALGDNWLRFIFPLPEFLLLFAIIWVLLKFNVVIFNMAAILETSSNDE